MSSSPTTITTWGSVGLTADELDLSAAQGWPNDLPMPRRLYHPPLHWWSTTDVENHFLDYPDFTSAADRARHIITAMARPVLTSLGSGEDDAVLPVGDGHASLTDLIAMVEHDLLDDVLARLSD